MTNNQTKNNHSLSPIITENENQLKQLQEWVAYGKEFLEGKNYHKNISDLKSKLAPNTILVFNLKEGHFEVISGKKHLDDYFLFGTSQELSERSNEWIHSELRADFYSFTNKLKKMNLIISELDINDVNYSFALIYHLELLNHTFFRKRSLVNLPLLEELHQKINKDEEFQKSLDFSIISSINETWKLLNPSNKKDTRNKTVHKLVHWSSEKILKIEKGLLSPDLNLYPNLIFIYTSEPEFHNGDIIHHYKTK